MNRDHDPIAALAGAAAATSAATALDISHVDALKLLYARLTGEDGPLGRAAYAVLRFHYVLPGPGIPQRGCELCHGTGQMPPAEAEAGGAVDLHCHCVCAWCACGDPLCLGPCGTLDAMLDAVLGSVSPSLAAQLRADASSSAS